MHDLLLLRCRFVHQINELRLDGSQDSSTCSETVAATEMTQIQLKLQEINLNLAPDPVFPSPGRSSAAGPVQPSAVVTTTNATMNNNTTAVVKKGSRLPFLHKLRKQL